MSHLRTVAGMLVLATLVGTTGCDQPRGDGEAPRQTASEPQAGPDMLDSREELVVPAAVRHMVRMEMRQMLSALNRVLGAAANDDGDGVAEAARSGGTAIAVDMDPALASALPDEFMQLGMSTHRAFDAVAEAADAGTGSDSVLATLHQLTNHCVACHTTYRLTVQPVEQRSGLADEAGD